MIAFVGSVFSPYYARARRRAAAGVTDAAAADRHCAVNVVLYRGRGGGRRGADGADTVPGQPGVSRWAMTERGRDRLQRDATRLRIGPSSLHWHGDTLTIDFDEVTAPWPSRLRGRVEVQARPCFEHVETLSAGGGHRWYPIAPNAPVEVTLERPALRWSGRGYLDSNAGDAPLEQAFRRWNWSRAHLSGGRAAVVYDVERIGEPRLDIGLAFDADGSVRRALAPPVVALPSTRWGIARETRCDTEAAPRVLQTLTDAPFYARSLVETTWHGEPVVALHESLSMPRFTAPWVQAMLPFRMPRRTAWLSGGVGSSSSLPG